MSCKICHCVAIPDYDLCPECFCNNTPFTKMVIGVEKYLDGTYVTDFGHVVEFDSQGKPFVIVDGVKLPWHVYIE